MAVSEDTKLQILHEHYKDTFVYLRGYIKIRDRLFLYLLFTIAVLLFVVSDPRATGLTVSQIIENKLGVKGAVSLSLLKGVVWFLLLGLALRYYQNVILIERQYRYIHHLEEQLSSFYGNNYFYREGKAYLNDYPWLTGWAHILYTRAFPMIFLVFAITQLISDWPGENWFDLSNLFNTAVCLGIIITVLLALLPRIAKTFACWRNHKTNNELSEGINTDNQQWK